MDSSEAKKRSRKSHAWAPLMPNQSMGLRSMKSNDCDILSSSAKQAKRPLAWCIWHVTKHPHFTKRQSGYHVTIQEKKGCPNTVRKCPT
jgi:hypothetical protein